MRNDEIIRFNVTGWTYKEISEQAEKIARDFFNVGVWTFHIIYDIKENERIEGTNLNKILFEAEVSVRAKEKANL